MCDVVGREWLVVQRSPALSKRNSILGRQSVDIDAYQLCPCQSGSKIKFCCGKDVISELNSILKKSGSGQTKAALGQLDRTIAKSGEKDCLLVIKTHILIAANEIEQAKQANSLFRKNSPGHPMGMQHLALLDLADGTLEDAINSLQNAMDAHKGAEIPLAVSNVYKIVASALVDSGHIFAGLSHLQFAGRLRGDGDNDISEMYMAMLREWAFFPFLFQSQMMEPTPEGVEWEKLYTNANRAIDRGQFRRALQYLTKIDNDFEDHAVVVRGLAVAKTMLAHKDAADAWRRYAALPGLNSTFAAEALAFAYMEDDTWMVADPILLYRYELDDVASASEKLMASKVFEPVETPESLPDGTPPPKYGFAVMDQPVAKETEGLTVDDVAQRIANAEIYGKQTDRPARLEIWVATSRLEMTLNVLAETGLELPEPEIETVQEDSIQQDTLLTMQAVLPQNIGAAEGDAMLLEHRRHRFLHDIPELQLDTENEISIREAAGKPELKNLVYARLLILVSNSKSRFAPEGTFEKMLESLGLPPMDAVAPDDFAALSSPLRCRSVDLKTASMEQLLALEASGFAVNDANMVTLALREQLQRDDRDKSMDAKKLLALAKCINGLEETLEHVKKAQVVARECDDRTSVGLALCDEFEMQLFLRDANRARAIIAEVGEYTGIDEVKYELTRILSTHGLLDASVPLEQFTASAAAAVQQEVGVAESTTGSGLILPD